MFKNFKNYLSLGQQSKILVLAKTKMKLVFDPKLKGIKELNKDLFKTKLNITVIKVNKFDFTKVNRLLRPFKFDSINNLKKYQDLDVNDSLYSTHKYILLDPEEFDLNKLDDKLKDELNKLLKVSNLNDCLEKRTIDVEYEDYRFDDVIRAIIPDNLLSENVNVRGYSIIGHIAHFNLRDKVLEYKHLIGKILLDKIPNIKTVVNKLNEIDNTFRNFSFEILAGINETIVKCKENECIFEFDFANVYWNPRLATEHERVVKLINRNDIVYDAFAGVGPFSIPAAKVRKCRAVLANDLNPNSYKYLCKNYEANINTNSNRKNYLLMSKCVPFERKLLNTNENYKFYPTKSFEAFNLDARDFIRTKLKYHFIETLNYELETNKSDNEFNGNIYVLMNLPALAVEFLDSFKELYDRNESEIIMKRFSDSLRMKTHLNIFCYSFCKDYDDDMNRLKTRIKKELLKNENLSIDEKYVRKVAPNKEMFCFHLKLKLDDLLTKNDNDNTLESNGNHKNKNANDHDADHDDADNLHQNKIPKLE